MREPSLFYFTTLRKYIKSTFNSVGLITYIKENDQLMIDDLRFPKPLYFKVNKKSNQDLIEEIKVEINANILMEGN